MRSGIEITCISQIYRFLPAVGLAGRGEEEEIRELNIEVIQNYYGLEAQTRKCIEELDELKDALKSGSEEAIIEEIADVYIMLAQIENLRRIVMSVENMIDYKVERTIKRIEEDEDGR